MKRALTTFGFLFAVLCAVNPARAQVGSPPEEQKYFRVPHKYHLYFELAGALPSSPGVFNDFWNSAFQFGVGGGYTIFPWLDLKGNFTYGSWDNNSTDSKGKIEYVGVEDVEGGLITTMTFSGSARFVAVPNARTNPFAEVSIGYYKTSADPITIEGVMEGTAANTMEDASGMMISPAIGIQYALADSWSAFAKYAYVLCSSTQFAPGDLLLPIDEDERVQGEDQVYQTIGVGIMLRF
ncbi:MAG TPA: outer membrane beta-barrel protein [Candidatus Krumholzibacteria bacterium]|nr:outer membrane beta-barrel protein [Candidatus Krumholzibacteria bacterium]